MSATPYPLDIKYRKSEKILQVHFSDGKNFSLPAEYLRVESPSAETRGHGNEERRLLPGRRYVSVMRIEPVGNYAVRLVFDDLHATGLYTWAYLYELGHDYEKRWTRYLSALTAAGLSRDPETVIAKSSSAS